ncbi:peptidase S16 [Gordonia sp. SID5947]|uniref:LON peptidase substrate-binding domain-containing protein n=1 Tax=Gordonia sp. SID5947 TaxID=2690315 RepID=UPI0013696B71|nr:LON peptidase substrate-binding domain-containing protein [Gordonia sp. SID5947]MYR08436.1 peptidase S16 [Gordonia sp. SID5947]
MFPLGTALLPGEPLPLRIFEPRYRQMLADCVGTDEQGSVVDGPVDAGFGVVLIARGHEVGGGDVRHDVGTFARIENLIRQPDGRASLTCTGTTRIRIVEWLPDDPYPKAVTEDLPEPRIGPDDHPRVIELGRALRAFVDEVAATRPEAVPVGLPDFDVADLGDHGLFEWAIRLPIGPADRQQLLECNTVSEQITVLDDVVEGLTAMIRFGR